MPHSPCAAWVLSRETFDVVERGGQFLNGSLDLGELLLDLIGWDSKPLLIHELAAES